MIFEIYKCFEFCTAKFKTTIFHPSVVGGQGGICCAQEPLDGWNLECQEPLHVFIEDESMPPVSDRWFLTHTKNHVVVFKYVWIFRAQRGKTKLRTK